MQGGVLKAPMRRALIAALCFASAARVFSAELIAEPEDSALRCLTGADKTKLAYPAGKVERKEGGVVRVRMTFSAADVPPRIEVPYAIADEVFKDAVVQHVTSYRLPCLRATDVPVVAVQEFQFIPGDGRKVIWSRARDAEPLRNALIECLTGADHLPAYPSGILSRDEQGTVFVRYAFKDGQSPPELKILYDGGNAAFASSVRAWALGLRLPCMPAQQAPLEAAQVFRFSFEGNHRSRLKEATLANFAGVVDHLKEQNVRFDFTTMSCPFEIRFELRQPYLPNGVGEVEKRDPNRREFIEWLKRVKLDIEPRDLRQVIGDSMTIAVPCSILDLT